MTLDELSALVKKLKRRISNLEKLCGAKSIDSVDSTVFFVNWDSDEDAPLPSINDCDDSDLAHLLEGCKTKKQAVSDAHDLASFESWTCFNVFACKGGKVSLLEAWKQDELGCWIQIK